LIDVAYPIVGPVESLGIDAVQLTHAFGEVAVGSFDEEVPVVPHLTVGVDYPVEALADLFQDLQPKFPIVIAQEYIVSPVPAGCDVVKGSGKLYT
jgi:hypothetical protein